MKPSSVEPGQVWVLEELGVPSHPRAPTFCGAFLVTRLTVLESARRSLGEPWTTQAFGLELDDPGLRIPELEPDGTVCIDYLENMLHEGERLQVEVRGMSAVTAPPREGQIWQLYGELVLIVGRLVPSWGPGYEGVEVHDAIYLSSGGGCSLEESYLLRDTSRVL